MICNPISLISNIEPAGVQAGPADDPKRELGDKHPLRLPKRFRRDDLASRGIYPFFQEVIDHLDGLPAKTFLDVGCITGELLEMIGRRRKGAALYGLNRSARMASQAGERLADRAKIMTWDARTIPLDDNQIDVVVSSKSFHDPEPLNTLAEIRRVLNHCGRLVLPAFKLAWPVCTLANAMIGHSTAGRVKRYSKNQILDLLDEAGFHFEKWTDIGNHGFVVSAMVVKPDHWQ